MSLTDDDKRWISAELERVETSLLTAFHDWAKTYEVRARSTSTAKALFDERLGLLEERVSKLERGGR